MIIIIKIIINHDFLKQNHDFIMIIMKNQRSIYLSFQRLNIFISIKLSMFYILQFYFSTK